MKYNKRSDLLSQKTFSRLNATDNLGQNIKTYATITNYYGVSGKTGAYTGTVTLSESLDTSNGGSKLTTTTNTLEWWDGGRQKTTVLTGAGTGSTTFTYDANGNLSLANIVGSRPHQTRFVTDALGQVIKRWETSSLASNPLQYYYNFDGKQVAEVGNDGVRNTSYDRTIELHRYGGSTFRYGGTGASGISFNTAYDRVNSYSSAEAPTSSSYVVRDGETLRSIARSLWADESLWYVLASANGLTGNEPLAGGVRLTVPSRVINARNNASTYRVYDPAEALGNLAPAPNSKKGAGCGGTGQILVAIIAAVVAFVAAPYAVSLLAGNGLAGAGVLTGVGAIPAAVAGGTLSLPAAIAGGAVAGAVGSVAGQGIGVLTGIQDRIDWRSVGMSALSGGVNSGLTSILGPVGNGFGAGAVRALQASAITQGLGVATGLQAKFDWVGLATAGLQGGVGSVVANSSWLNTSIPATDNPLSPASLVNALTPGLAGGITAAAVRSAATGTDFGDNLRSVLPDVIGNTIGNAIAGVQAKPSPRNGRIDNSAPGQDGIGPYTPIDESTLLTVQQEVAKARPALDAIDLIQFPNVTFGLDSSGNRKPLVAGASDTNITSSLDGPVSWSQIGRASDLSDARDFIRSLDTSWALRRPANAASTPVKVNLSHLDRKFQQLMAQSYPGGKDLENGGTIFVDRNSSVSIGNIGGMTSRPADGSGFNPDLSVRFGIKSMISGLKVAGVFHTHPYNTAEDGGNHSITFSGQDVAQMMNENLSISIVQSNGGNQWMLTSTQKTSKGYFDPRKMENYTVSRRLVWQSRGYSFSDAQNIVIRDLANRYNMGYYEGKNGVFNRVYPK